MGGGTCGGPRSVHAQLPARRGCRPRRPPARGLRTPRSRAWRGPRRGAGGLARLPRGDDPGRPVRAPGPRRRDPARRGGRRRRGDRIGCRRSPGGGAGRRRGVPALAGRAVHPRRHRPDRGIARRDARRARRAARHRARRDPGRPRRPHRRPHRCRGGHPAGRRPHRVERTHRRPRDTTGGHRADPRDGRGVAVRGPAGHGDGRAGDRHHRERRAGGPAAGAGRGRGAELPRHAGLAGRGPRGDGRARGRSRRRGGGHAGVVAGRRRARRRDRGGRVRRRAPGPHLDPYAVFTTGATLRPVAVGSRAQLVALVHAVGTHRIRPVIDRVFPFDHAPEAFRHYLGGTALGKVVITCSPNHERT
jgi:hypothetical protein